MFLAPGRLSVYFVPWDRERRSEEEPLNSRATYHVFSVRTTPTDCAFRARGTKTARLLKDAAGCGAFVEFVKKRGRKKTFFKGAKEGLGRISGNTHSTAFPEILAFQRRTIEFTAITRTRDDPIGLRHRWRNREISYWNNLQDFLFYCVRNLSELSAIWCNNNINKSDSNLLLIL